MSVIVAIHDAPTVTRRCLASLEKYASEAEVVLVDDASCLNETLDVIQHFSSRNGWKVIRHQQALGHSDACRAGANVATRPYLCLLNSDTVVTPWCWLQIKKSFESDEKIGIAGPSTSVSGNVQTLSLAKHLGFCWNDNQICAFANRLLTQLDGPATLDLTWISGFAFFIRRSLWEQFGGFDPKLPDYGNEEELCNRVAEKGYRLVWVRNSYIHHFSQQSYEDKFGDKGIRARQKAAGIYIKQKRRPTLP
jgi:GT2 family glycosyltransferase